VEQWRRASQQLKLFNDSERLNAQFILGGRLDLFSRSSLARASSGVFLKQAGNPSAGLNALDALPQSSVVNYQPFWAARGHLLRLLNRNQEAHEAFTRAASLTDDPALREYLFKRATSGLG